MSLVFKSSCFFPQEAAKILKIKGLWESGLDQARDESEEEENEIAPQVDVNVGAVKPVVGKDPPVSPSMPELKSPPSIAQLKSMMQVVGSKRRKRSRNGTGSIEEVQEGAKQTKASFMNQVSINDVPQFFTPTPIVTKSHKPVTSFIRDLLQVVSII